ncbi:MAG: peptidylprolyl isomerase [Holosporales bacterium]
MGIIRYLLLFLILVVPVAQAVDAPQIVAVVNDEPISGRELAARTRLALFSGGITPTPEAMKSYSGQALQQMINEILQTGEAKRQGITVTDAEVAESIADLEKQNRMESGKLKTMLAERDIPLATLESQVRANILWGRLIRRNYGARISVSPQEVDDVRERLSRARGKEEFALSEIVLRTDPTRPESATEVEQLAKRLFDDVAKGGDFAALAREFSSAPTAAAGGELGWILAEEIDKKRFDALRNLPSGAVAKPLREDGGITLLWLRGRRLLGGGEGAPLTRQVSDKNATVALFQTVLEIPSGIDEKDLLKLRDKMIQATKGIRSCADAQRVAAKVGNSLSGSLGRLSLGRLPGPVREAVTPLAVGESTRPLLTNGVLTVFTICDRSAPPVQAAQAAAPFQMPNDDQIRERLRQQKMQRHADSLLRELRRTSFVDMREKGASSR